MEALELCESGLEQIISCPLPIMNLTNSQFKIGEVCVVDQ